MPGIVDWRTSPLQIVDQIFRSEGGSNSDWHLSVDKFFKDKFEQVDQEKVDQKTQVGETESAKSVAGGSGGSQATFVVDCRR